MAARTPRRNRGHAASIAAVLTDMEDPYYYVSADPYADALLSQAAQLRHELHAQDDEFDRGWAA